MPNGLCLHCSESRPSIEMSWKLIAYGESHLQLVHENGKSIEPLYNVNFDLYG